MSSPINNAPNAPQAIGPYSQGVEANGFVFLSGQIPLDPKTGALVDGDIELQTEQVLRNIAAVLMHEGLGLKDIVKSTIFLKDMADFQKVNAIYERAFGSTRPARSTVQVAGLPKDSLIEIEVIAAK